MKKYLSVLFTAIFASIIVISSVTSCVTKEDVSINSKNLIGTWEETSSGSPFTGVVEIEGELYVQFQKDGTYIMVDIEENDVDILRGKWSLSGNSLFVSDEFTIGEETYPTTSTFTVSNLTKNSLTFSWVGIATANFKRVSDSIIEKYL